jgi:cadmium resistance protein CadD (predicted permease)
VPIVILDESQNISLYSNNICIYVRYFESTHYNFMLINIIVQDECVFFVFYTNTVAKTNIANKLYKTNSKTTLP